MNNELFTSEVFWKEFIDKEFKDREIVHINDAHYTSELNIYNMKIVKNSTNNVVKVNFDLGMLVYECKGIGENYTRNKIIYPVFIELNTIKNIFEIRLKSKSRIYMIREDEAEGSRITIDSMYKKIILFFKGKMSFNEEDIRISKTAIYRSYFNILNDFTSTPQQIEDKINTKIGDTDGFVDGIFDNMNLNMKYLEMAKEDLKIWLEKFISLSEPNKDIFFKNRDGYPIKLIATDADETRLEEMSANEEPLQTKPSFFDHKKIFQRERLCDGMTLAFQRKDNLYYGKLPFQVVMYSKNGYAVINFTEYVEEEDIQNVLSRITESL